MWLLGLLVGWLVPGCLLAVFVGSPCQFTSDCAQLNASHCYEGFCACKTGHVQSLGKIACVPQVIGRSCISGAQVCDIEYSYCDNGVCACVRPTHVASYNKTTCLPVVSVLRGPCSEDQQCMNDILGQDTMCIDRECVCRRYGTTMFSKKCDPMKKLDDWCLHSQQCDNIGHASCVQGRCACDPYFVPYSSSRTECVPIATRLGSPCRQHVQCTAAFGEGGFCSEDGRCQCLGRFHFVHNLTVSCVLSRGLSERCTLSDECWLPLDGGHLNSECVDGVCVCRAGLEPRADNEGCAGSGILSLFSASQLMAFTLLTTTVTTLLGLGISRAENYVVLSPLFNNVHKMRMQVLNWVGDHPKKS